MSADQHNFIHTHSCVCAPACCCRAGRPSTAHAGRLPGSFAGLHQAADQAAGCAVDVGVLSKRTAGGCRQALQRVCGCTEHQTIQLRLYCQVVVLWVHAPEQPRQVGVSHTLNTVRLIVRCYFCPVGLQAESYVHNGGRVLLAGGVCCCSATLPACSVCCAAARADCVLAQHAKPSTALLR